MRPAGITGDSFSDVILVQKYAEADRPWWKFPTTSPPLGVVIGRGIHPHQEAIHVLTEFNIESWFLSIIVVLTLNNEKYDTDR